MGACISISVEPHKNPLSSKPSEQITQKPMILTDEYLQYRAKQNKKSHSASEHHSVSESHSASESGTS